MASDQRPAHFTDPWTRAAEQDLVDLGASAECLQAFREHVLARFGSA